MKDEKVDNVDGYSLYNDIENLQLRCNNQGVALANILEDNMRNNKVSYEGVEFAKMYVDSVPEEHRMYVINKSKEVLLERGYCW